MDFKEKFKFISRHFEFDLDSNKLRDSDGNLNFIDSYGVLNLTKLLLRSETRFGG
jgi:hypothetical protein